MIPRFSAIATASSFEWAPSFWSTDATWLRTVSREMNSRSAMAWFEAPDAITSSTSSSRRVSWSASGVRRLASRGSTRASIVGLTRASPALAERMAAMTSPRGWVFVTKPVQPASMAATSTRSSSDAVSMTTATDGEAASTAPATATPSAPPARRWSVTTTSGLSRRTASTACSRSAARATTSRSGSLWSARCNVSAKTWWSSTSTIRVVIEEQPLR